ncbi:MAG: polyol transport system permease protein, partial [Thermomicrobiales bacterium]|nr:polyol transport system permease protein [Thermomicrobiales bacterium]
MIRQATGRSSGFRKEQAPIYWTITAWAVGLIVFFPVLYIVLTGLKSEATAITLPPKLIFRPTLEQYREISSRGFFPFFRNSIIASLVSTLIVLILAVPAAYALALRPMKRWRDVLFFFISTK